MVGQILPNNNEKCYSNFSPKFYQLNTALKKIWAQMQIWLHMGATSGGQVSTGPQHNDPYPFAAAYVSKRALRHTPEHSRGRLVNSTSD
jgi:hypothetical protein